MYRNICNAGTHSFTTIHTFGYYYLVNMMLVLMIFSNVKYYITSTSMNILACLAYIQQTTYLYINAHLPTYYTYPLRIKIHKRRSVLGVLDTMNQGSYIPCR